MTRRMIPMNNGEYYVLRDERLTEEETVTLGSAGAGSGWRVSYRRESRPDLIVWLAGETGAPDMARVFATPEEAHFYADWWINRINEIRVWSAMHAGAHDMYLSLGTSSASNAHERASSASSTRRASRLRSLDDLYVDLPED